MVVVPIVVDVVVVLLVVVLLVVLARVELVEVDETALVVVDTPPLSPVEGAGDAELALEQADSARHAAKSARRPRITIVATS